MRTGAGAAACQAVVIVIATPQPLLFPESLPRCLAGDFEVRSEVVNHTHTRTSIGKDRDTLTTPHTLTATRSTLTPTRKFGSQLSLSSQPSPPSWPHRAHPLLTPPLLLTHKPPPRTVHTRTDSIASQSRQSTTGPRGTRTVWL